MACVLSRRGYPHRHAQLRMDWNGRRAGWGFRDRCVAWNGKIAGPANPCDVVVRRDADGGDGVERGKRADVAEEAAMFGGRVLLKLRSGGRALPQNCEAEYQQDQQPTLGAVLSS